MNYKKILEDIQKEIEPLFSKGKVADYIPALACVEPHQFAMSITMFDGTEHHVGDHQKKFSIQSISKVFTLALALEELGTSLYKRLGVEPSGSAFNSLVQLEYENGIPRNPFINAGAIVITDALLSLQGDQENTINTILEFIRTLSNNPNIGINQNVAQSELAHGNRNLALAYMLKSYKNLDNDVTDVLETYFNHCAIEMSTQELSRAMLFLANRGVDPITNISHISKRRAKRINAIMLTCGHYDASGEFAFDVGLPGKSGVGGGIVAIVPSKMSICVFSPQLNKNGNSLIGTKALELFTTKTGFSIF